MAATSKDFVHPEFLVATEWLAAHLGQSDLRILDCSVSSIVAPAADARGSRRSGARVHLFNFGANNGATPPGRHIFVYPLP